MTQHFALAHAFTEQWEGGLSEHPSDPGGITNHGISLRWLLQLEDKVQADMAKAAATCDGVHMWEASPHDYNGDGTVDAEDIRACSKEHAALLLREHFWAPLGCGQLPLALALVLYDTAVNTGAHQGVLLLQRACNVVGEGHLDIFTPLIEDGLCGKKTKKLCNDLQENTLDFYTARLFVRQRKDFYTKLTHKNSKLTPFLTGWKNRCNALLQYLADLEREI